MRHASFISRVGNARRDQSANAAIRKLEAGPKRSNSPVMKRPQKDGICSFWKKGACKKGKDGKFTHPKNSAPAEKDSDDESDAGSDKKKKKKKAKTEPVTSTGSLWEDSEREAESIVVRRTSWIAMLRPNAHPQLRTPSCTFPTKEESGQRAWCSGNGLSTMMVT